MATLPTPPTDLPPEDFFLRHLALIQEIIEFCCRRAHLKPEEAEDFGGRVKIKLIEDDYAVVRQFEGRSTPKTYFTIVIRRLLLDYQDSLWGKWRPCADAMKLGPVGLQLDQLINRDGYSFSEACQLLWTRDKVELSESQIADIWAKIRPRLSRQKVGEDTLEYQASPGPSPEDQVLQKEKAGVRQRVYKMLGRALDTLDSEDKLLVLMRTEYSVADIARIRKTDQKPLYRRLEKIYKQLRKELERNGVRRGDIDDILESLEPDYPDF
jgi:RNA polymerase sigma factor (sigma-70 family)